MHSPKFRTEVKSKFTKMIERVAELGAASASEEGSAVRGPKAPKLSGTVAPRYNKPHSKEYLLAGPKIVARPIYLTPI